MITERIDAVTKVYPANGVLPAPKSVKIELSPRCNYRCKFCSLRNRDCQPKEEDDMDINLFKRITKEMSESGVEEIGVFYLGESFMNPGLLVEAIRYLKEEIEMPYVFLTSNASLATEDWVKKIMLAGLDSLKWSVNAADASQFKNIMDISVRWFYKALTNIKNAKRIRDENGFRTKLYASSIKYDGEQQQKMEELLSECVIPYVDQHYWLPLYSMGMYSSAIKEKMGYMPRHGNMGRIDEETGLPNRQPLPCWAVAGEGHVRSDGHLSACCFGSDDRFDTGDLTKQSFMDAWNSVEFQNIRNAHVRTITEGPEALKGTMCEVCCAW